SNGPPNPIGPLRPSPATDTPHPAPPCSQRANFPAESRRLTSRRAPPPPLSSAWSPGVEGGALSITPLNHISAASLSATGYPTSTRTRGPLPTPDRLLSRSRTGPAEIPTHGCGAAAARASANIIIRSSSGREDE